MKNDIILEPNLTSLGLCFYKMMLEDAKEFNVPFDDIKNTFELDDNGIATWDIPIKDNKI